MTIVLNRNGVPTEAGDIADELIQLRKLVRLQREALGFYQHIAQDHGRMVANEAIEAFERFERGEA